VIFEKRFNAFGDGYQWFCIGLKPAKKGNYRCAGIWKLVGRKNHFYDDW
jgi:hypothetical protein